MDIKLECVDLLVCALVFACVSECVCVCLCVVRKLPADTSPREVLELVCLGLVWERVGWKCACSSVGVGFSLHIFDGEGLQTSAGIE